MLGKIKRSLKPSFLKTKKKYKRGTKKVKTPAGVNYRDYRGPMGVVEDAQKTK